MNNAGNADTYAEQAIVFDRISNNKVLCHIHVILKRCQLIVVFIKSCMQIKVLPARACELIDDNSHALKT